MTEENAQRLSTKKLLAIFEKSKASNRQVLETLCQPGRSKEVTTARWLGIFRNCPMESKLMVWGVLKLRTDLSISQLQGIDLYCRGFSGCLRTITDEAHNLGVKLRKGAQAA